MDFSQIFPNSQGNNTSISQSFEDKVTAKTQSVDNNENQNNAFQKLLPLLASGKSLDANNLMQMLGENSNPQMSSLMSLMPMLKNFQQNTITKKQSKKKFEYIKITEYYKK